VRQLVAAAVVGAVWLAGGHRANAQAASPASHAASRATPTHPLIDWGLPAVFIGSTFAIGPPDHCRWCDRDDAGRDTLNGFDRRVRSSLRWQHTGTASTVSWVTEFAPVGLLLSLNHDRLVETALPVFQAFGTTYALTHIAKVAAGRQRPVVHFGGAPPDDANASFFSGHSSGAFSTVFALARVNADRDDPHTTWVWLVGVPLAASTAYLRVAADKHYATDVLTGAAVGAATGWWLPGVWGPSGGARPSIVPSALPGGGQLSLGWQW
jgi:membrane-associated phospholipid phosphatase